MSAMSDVNSWSASRERVVPSVVARKNGSSKSNQRIEVGKIERGRDSETRQQTRERERDKQRVCRLSDL
jgi:hypothetical protein